MKKFAALMFVAVFVSINVGFSWVGNDDDDMPKYKTKQVMAKVFKGKASLKAKISAGKATAEEKKTALEYLQALAKNKPKKGDAASWTKKTLALVKAAKQVVDGKEGGIKSFNAATNCKACHNLHK